MLVLFTALFISLGFNYFSGTRMVLFIQVLSFLVFFFFSYIYVGVCSFSYVSSFFFFNPLNVILVVLSFWISMLMVMVSIKYEFLGLNSRSFVFTLFILLLSVVLFFVVDSFFLLYIFFEFSLIPTMFLILKWGYQPERLQATFYFVMYTVCASLPLLLFILSLGAFYFSFSMCNEFNLFLVNPDIFCHFSYFSMVFAFLVKVPMWGVHLWLPKAHTEAPVSGSMILAGVLLKLGGYGLIQICHLLYTVNLGVINVFFSVNLWGAFLISFVCLCSMDMKILIAYSSVVHMGLMVVSFFKGSVIGLLGGVVMMVAHGLSSPGMFAVANLNYEFIQTRNLMFQKGIGYCFPVLNMIWFLLVCSNMAAPPSLNLFSEILICVSVLKFHIGLSVILAFVTFFSAAYNLYLFSAQQSKTIFLLGSSSFFSCSAILMSFLHLIPVYFGVLCVFVLF